MERPGSVTAVGITLVAETVGLQHPWLVVVVACDEALPEFGREPEVGVP